MSGRRIEISEADLREFIEAATEVRDEATHVPTPYGYPSGSFNALDDGTERRFDLALESLKFDLASKRATT